METIQSHAEEWDRCEAYFRHPGVREALRERGLEVITFDYEAYTVTLRSEEEWHASLQILMAEIRPKKKKKKR